MPMWYSLSFQNGNSPIMEQMIFFHDHSMIIIILIVMAVLYSMISLIATKKSNNLIYENQSIETFWTISPAFILISIAIPSLRLLYITEENNTPNMSLKTTGYQWYWSYEYSDFPEINYDSFMKKSSTMRLIDVSNRTPLPMKSNIRILITANDVIHSWTVPSLGVKADAVPGRLNQCNLYINRPGVYFGQCSEICGANHSFMPISIESMKMNSFLKFIKSF